MMTRRWLGWTAVVVLVGQVGCAARGGVPVHAAPTWASTPISQEKCEDFAQREMDATETLGSAAWALLYPPWFVILAGPVLWKRHQVRSMVRSWGSPWC